VVLHEGRELHMLDLDSAHVRWQRITQTPVATEEVVGDLVLVRADRLTAYTVGSGSERWQSTLDGARVAGTLDGKLVIAASGSEGVVPPSTTRGPKWRTEIPGSRWTSGLPT
jgi:hypothetical protein